MPRKPPVVPDSAASDEFGLPPIIHTEVLCHLTGITARRLHQLITDKRIPAECNFTGDKWRTTQTLCEVFGYYRRRADQARPPAERQLEIQNTIEDLRAKRLKNAKMARELLPRHVYVQVWGELINGFKSRWLGFSEKMGPRAFRAKDKVHATEILEKEVIDIFAALQDPKFMEDIASKIHDDEFEQPPGTDNPPGNPAQRDEDLEPEDA